MTHTPRTTHDSLCELTDTPAFQSSSPVRILTCKCATRRRIDVLQTTAAECDRRNKDTGRPVRKRIGYAVAAAVIRKLIAEQMDGHERP